MTVSLALVVD